MIEVKNLSHSYGNDDVLAVKNISFHVEQGETFGFLGPSGAGKSTTQNILTGLLDLQQGEVTVAGYDIRKKAPKRFNSIGVSFEQANVYGKLTALENLQYYASLFDVPTRDPMELLELVGLQDHAKERASTFSKGMKHRLTFARSMLNSPKLWFLDEPTTGLDPAIAATIKDIIRQEKARGTTVFLTTHNMYIAEELCDRVAFIVDGKIKLKPGSFTLRNCQTGEETFYEFPETEVLTVPTYQKINARTGRIGGRIYLMPDEASMIRMADKTRKVGATTSVDEEGNVCYRYYNQGYETEQVLNSMYVLHTFDVDVVDHQMALQKEITIGTVPRLNSRQAVVPVYVTLACCLMGIFIVCAYVFLDKQENVIKAFLVTPGPLHQYLAGKILLMLPMLPYYAGSFDPQWIHFLPSYPVLMSFKQILQGQPEISYVLLTAGGCLLGGVGLQELAVLGFRRTICR